MPGVVAEPVTAYVSIHEGDRGRRDRKHIRIHVGNGVYIIRPRARCRMAATLPIDVVPGRDPPIFRWTQLVDTPAGKRVLAHEQALPPICEVAVARLVGVAKQLLMDNAALRGTVDGQAERIAAQDELLSKRAEAPAAGTPKKGK